MLTRCLTTVVRAGTFGGRSPHPVFGMGAAESTSGPDHAASASMHRSGQPPLRVAGGGAPHPSPHPVTPPPAPPSAALVTAEVFLELNLNKEVEKEAGKALSAETAKFHLNVLTKLQRHLKHSPQWKRIPITRAATRLLLIQASIRKWKPQTLHRNAAALHGAMSTLPLYSNAKVATNFGQDPYWINMMKFWRLKSNQAQPHGQAAVLTDEVQLAINAVPHNQLETKAALVIMWSTSARFSDIINMKKEALDWNPQTKKLRITVSEGKVMAKVQPYTVATQVLTDDMAAVLNLYLPLVKEPQHYLFPIKTIDRKKRLANLNDALKMVNKEYTTRAIRRGALQAMAINNVPLKDIMAYSGHKSEETCKRYLDWGRLCINTHKAMEAAATHLHRGSSRH